MSIESLTVFSRLNGVKPPEAVYAVFIPDKGWCRFLNSYMSRLDWCWSNKASKYIATDTNASRLARRIKKASMLDVTVVNLLNIKTWTGKEFVAEFEFARKAIAYKHPRGKCKTCNRTVMMKKDGNPIIHYCYCNKCRKGSYGQQCSHP